MQGYLREMEIPDSYFEKILTTPSYSVIDLYANDTLPLATSPAFTEWLVARCASRAKTEEEYKCWGREFEAIHKARHAQFLAAPN